MLVFASIYLPTKFQVVSSYLPETQMATNI